MQIFPSENKNSILRISFYNKRMIFTKLSEFDLFVLKLFLLLAKLDFSVNSYGWTQQILL